MDIDEYIAAQPPNIQQDLRTVHLMILMALKIHGATETISWQMPTYRQGSKNIIHFAAQKRHIGLYSGAEAMAHFAPRLTRYKTSKGAIQFPYKDFGGDEIKLITEIASWCGTEATGYV